MLAQSLVEYGAIASALRGAGAAASSAAQAVTSLGPGSLALLAVLLVVAVWLLRPRT
jgi:hypothetical protein